MKPRILINDKPVRADILATPAIITAGWRRALNEAAFAGMRGLQARMGQVFDSPTPYTLSALTVVQAPATGPLTAEVAMKGRPDTAGTGVPQESYLRAQVLGGNRRYKRFEILLWRRGYLPRGMYAVPGQAARLDAYGNMSRGQIIELLSYLQAFTVARGERRAGYRANSTKATRDRRSRGTRTAIGNRYFVHPVGEPGLAPGIYRAQSTSTRAAGPVGKPRLVVAFVKEPRYGVKLRFWDELQRLTDAELAARVDAAVDRERRRAGRTTA